VSAARGEAVELLALTCRLAPEATTIWFSPAASTAMKAAPVEPSRGDSGWR
jgi:hypothetical protein